MKQVDLDFCYERRQEMIDYVIEKYGRDSISQIITFSTMAARAAIKAVGRALDVPYNLQDKVSKMMIEPIIKDSMSANQDLVEMYKVPAVKELIDISIELEGLPLYTSTHAAGVLVTDEKGVLEHVPLWLNDNSIVAQYPMSILDELGMLKEDFLGLKTLTIIRHTIKHIKENYGIDVSLDELYECRDPKVFEIIQKGLTEGLFQIEGEGMTELMKEMAPENMEELIAGIALYRPGPMQYIPKYLNNRRNKDQVTYAFKELEPILKETYGVLTYQEQCMQAVIAVAGYEKHHSDSFRKAVGKKKADLIEMHRGYFIYGREEIVEAGKVMQDAIPGGLKMGHDLVKLEKFYDDMEFFGKYAFNKSHAAAYAVIAYATAWLKTYYPAEFMSATIDMRIKEKEKVHKYIHHTKELGIEMLVPDINVGSSNFQPKQGKIVSSLLAKNVGESTLDEIVKERERSGNFKSMDDFLKRCFHVVDKSTFQSLIYIGAFDSLNIRRSSYIAGAEDLMKLLTRIRTTKKKIDNGEYKTKRVFDFDKMFEKSGELIPELSEFPEQAMLKKEKELLGFYISGHPLESAKKAIKFSDKTGEGFKFKASDLSYDIIEGETILSNPNIKNRENVKFPCILSEVSKILTKAKKQMAIIKVEDLSGQCKGIVFPRDYEVLKDKLEEGVICILSGSLSIKIDEAPMVICTQIEEINQRPVKRIILKTNNIEALKDELIKKRMYGDDPTYLELDNKIFLLERRLWLNRDFVIKYLNRDIASIKIENW